MREFCLCKFKQWSVYRPVPDAFARRGGPRTASKTLRSRPVNISLQDPEATCAMFRAFVCFLSFPGIIKKQNSVHNFLF